MATKYLSSRLLCGASSWNLISLFATHSWSLEIGHPRPHWFTERLRDIEKCWSRSRVISAVISGLLKTGILWKVLQTTLQFAVWKASAFFPGGKQCKWNSRSWAFRRPVSTHNGTSDRIGHDFMLQTSWEQGVWWSSGRRGDIFTFA